MRIHTQLLIDRLGSPSWRFVPARPGATLGRSRNITATRRCGTRARSQRVWAVGFRILPFGMCWMRTVSLPTERGASWGRTAAMTRRARPYGRAWRASAAGAGGDLAPKTTRAGCRAGRRCGGIPQCTLEPLSQRCIPLMGHPTRGLVAPLRVGV